MVQKDTCTPVFIAALFTVVKTWKPKCPLTDKWIKKIKKMCYVIYIIEYYSAIKKNEIMEFSATWMDLEIILSEEKSDRERQISYDIP